MDPQLLLYNFVTSETQIYQLKSGGILLNFDRPCKLQGGKGYVSSSNLEILFHIKQKSDYYLFGKETSVIFLHLEQNSKYLVENCRVSLILFFIFQVILYLKFCDIILFSEKNLVPSPPPHRRFFIEICSDHLREIQYKCLTCLHQIFRILKLIMVSCIMPPCQVRNHSKFIVELYKSEFYKYPQVNTLYYFFNIFFFIFL